MAHTRKSEGGRKDKKNANMRKAVADRKEHAAQETPGSDQGDIQTQKPGSANDTNRRHG